MSVTTAIIVAALIVVAGPVALAVLGYALMMLGAGALWVLVTVIERLHDWNWTFNRKRGAKSRD